MNLRVAVVEAPFAVELSSSEALVPEKGLEGGGGGGGVGLEEQTALKKRPEPFGSGKHWPLGI